MTNSVHGALTLGCKGRPSSSALYIQSEARQGVTVHLGLSLYTLRKSWAGRRDLAERGRDGVAVPPTAGLLVFWVRGSQRRANLERHPHETDPRADPQTGAVCGSTVRFVAVTQYSKPGSTWWRRREFNLSPPSSIKRSRTKQAAPSRTEGYVTALLRGFLSGVVGAASRLSVLVQDA